MNPIHLEIFRTTLYVSVGILILGMIIRVVRWYLLSINMEDQRFSPGEKFGSSIKAILKTIFSMQLFTLIKIIVLDVFLQRRIFKENFSRWLMHILIYAGFIALIFMHALDEPITQKLFSDYSSTLNPYMFLRNLFAAMVVIGIIIAIYRRKTKNILNQTTKNHDKYALIILGIIFISGFLLEAVKILSPRVFHQMVEEYTFGAEPEDIEPLRMYWARDFLVNFPDLKDTLSFDEEMIEMGIEVHQESCADCHSKPEWAFMSYSLAIGIKSIAQKLDESDAHIWLWYIHFLACFIGMACLPFTKFLHIFTTPLSMIINGIQPEIDNDSINKPVKQAIELDACAHCSVCSIHCSVAPAFQLLNNECILPSEKLKFVKELSSKKKLDNKRLFLGQEGSFICTSCYRCTNLCPAGINLHDMWTVSKNQISKQGYQDFHKWVRDSEKIGWQAKVADSFKQKPGSLKNKYLNFASNKDTFTYCMQCQTCSSVCPVVSSNDNPLNHLNQTPQRVMNLLRQGLIELAMDVRLVWDCTTCYMCQENCPQDIPVTEILYELKNLSYERKKTC